MVASSEETICVIDCVEQASAMMDETRLLLLKEMVEPHSATTLAKKLDWPRQRVNYHLRELERVGLLELVEERKRRNCTERVLKATARSYVINPEALVGIEATPETVQDRFSWAYLVSVAARTIKELAHLRKRADKAGQKLATLTTDTHIRVASPAKFEAFAAELVQAVGELIDKYNDHKSRDGRLFRVIGGVYQAITKHESDS